MQRPGLRTVLANFAGKKEEVAMILTSSTTAIACTIEAMGDDYVTVVHRNRTKYVAIEHIVVVWPVKKHEQTP